MKLRKPILTLFLLVIFVYVAIANSEYKNISKTINSLNISIDGRQEIISIIQYLGGYFRLNNLQLDYKVDIDKYFSDFKEHEAVKFVQELTKQDFTYDAPPTAMLYFTYDFHVDKEFPEYIIERIGGEANLKEFKRLIKKFAEDTKFNNFLSLHSDFYIQTVNDFVSKLSDFQEVKTIEKFYGKKQSSYNIILSILNLGNYGPTVNSNGKMDVYNILSAIQEKNGKPLFGNNKRIEYLVWHEFGHSFVNYLTHNNIKLVTKYENLKEPIKAKMDKQAYGDWETIVNEHVVRAVTLKLSEEKYGLEAANEIKSIEINRSFYYIEPLCEQIDMYIKNRNTYKTFSDFYPFLIENAFNKAQTQNYPGKYLKNLNNTFKDIDFIVITENIEEEILAYVKEIKNSFFENIPLITDREAMKKDLSKYSFLIYGTIKNNLLLQEFKNYLPIQISDSVIYADKEYRESNAKVIFNMKNPLNEEKYITVYTAQKTKGILNINDVFHGPTNYIVFENRQKVYKSGFFIKENNKWICK